jgi:hypothetical protein
VKRFLLSLIIAVTATLIIFLLLFRSRQNRLDVSPEVQREIDRARRR